MKKALFAVLVSAVALASTGCLSLPYAAQLSQLGLAGFGFSQFVNFVQGMTAVVTPAA